MKSNLFLIYFLLLSFWGFSQNYNIDGKIKERGTDLTIPGVSIFIKGGSQGSTSDFDGKFSLNNIPAGSVVVFSYIGFENYEIVVNNSMNNLTIELSEDSKVIEDVVVIGYGTQRKRDVTGAVSVIDAKTIENIKPIKIEQALQGTVSGVIVTTQSGAPGAALDIRIRGIATNGENRPTAIIDGYVGELGLLNPNDIESITVLKDAQAAIYGTIGANGIILVTTKKGKKNMKTAFEYNVYSGFQETSRKLPLLNGTEYALMVNEAFANGGRPVPFPNIAHIGKGTDWQDEVFGKGVPIINHDLSIRGGSDKITYSFSGSHLDQEGLVGGKKSGFLRNTARMAVNADLTDKLKVNANLIYTYFNRKTLNENVLGSVLFNALNMPANINPYDSEGAYSLVPNLADYGTEIINPLAQIENTYNDYNFKKINGTFGLSYEIIKGLKLNSNMGFNTGNSRSKTFGKEVDYGGKIYDVKRSSVTQGAVNDNNYSFDLFLNYNFKLAEKHQFEITLGNTIFKEWGEGLYATGYDVPYNSWDYADISLTKGLSDALTNSSYAYDERRLSYFARLNYDYDGKYLFSAMIRRDASTKFGPENAVAYFPSVTAGWVISEESFFKQNNTLNFLKFRISYGTLGNDQIGNNGYVSLLNGEATYVFDNALTNGTSIGRIPNPDLKWEEAQKFDVGLDMEFFNKKLTLTTDYFIDTRKDLLIQNIPISGITGGAAPGSANPTINAGTVRNSGLELALGYKDQINSDFSFNVNYNVTFLKNEVLKVNNGTGFLSGGNFNLSDQPSRMQEGYSIGNFYGYKTDGIFQNQAEVDAHPSQIALGANATPGDLRFVDINGDGVIDADDRTNLGDPIPDVLMGFNFGFNYKDFDFSVYTYASIGNDMVRNYERDIPMANRLNYVLDRWTGEGTSNSIPKVTTGATGNNVFSDYFVEDASYLRIQNVQLGYTINKKYTEKVGITKARVYFAVNNLYTFTKYKGYDPAASTGDPVGGGVDFGFYPVPRTFILGANINF